MKRLLNTLFVTTQGASVSRDRETVLVRVEQETKLRIPVHTLNGIVCFGRVSCSPQLMKLCGERKVAISFLSPYGRFWARVQGPVSGNVLLRREQYRRADDARFVTEVARSLVFAKVANCRKVLMRAIRDHPETPHKAELDDAVTDLARIAESLGNAGTPEAMRGHEGEAARTYFGVFDHLIVAQKKAFFFKERSRRPPLDNMNALLSFCYSLLTNDVVSALETVGLDPAVGYLHPDRPGRPSLALDLVEEFRPLSRIDWLWLW